MNQFGKTSRLEITAARSKSGMTFIEDSFFTAPFKIMKPFESEDGGITVFQQVSSAGILAGDIQEHNFTVKKKAKLEIVSQSFEKIFKMNEGEIAERKILLHRRNNSRIHFHQAKHSFHFYEKEIPDVFDLICFTMKIS